MRRPDPALTAKRAPIPSISLAWPMYLRQPGTGAAVAEVVVAAVHSVVLPHVVHGVVVAGGSGDGVTLYRATADHGGALRATPHRDTAAADPDDGEPVGGTAVVSCGRVVAVVRPG